MIEPSLAVGVGLQTLVVKTTPLMIASIPSTPKGLQLDSALRAAGLRPLTHVIGANLPLGAKVGFRLEDGELRLVDLDGEILLRAERGGIDKHWVQAALKLRGTMLVMVTGTVLPQALVGQPLAQMLDQLAGAGQVFGAVVGVEEARMRLPLVF